MTSVWLADALELRPELIHRHKLVPTALCAAVGQIGEHEVYTDVRHGCEPHETIGVVETFDHGILSLNQSTNLNR